MEGDDDRVVIVGAGPAGLTAAWELARQGHTATVLEREPVPGGLSRTLEHRGYRFDIGGHRFFTKVPEVWQLWSETLGEEFLQRPRLSRIFYDGRFFDYPLRPARALVALGPLETARIACSYLTARLFPSRTESTFEEWVTNRFGRRLFEIFFRTYTEKVWGVPCSEISADWAAQRIKTLDLTKAILSTLPLRRRREIIPTLIDSFYYPRLGPGQMWERLQQRLATAGTPTRFEARVVRISHSGGRARTVTVTSGGRSSELPAEHVISSMPITTLIESLAPPAPAEVREAAANLRYRDFIIVVLIVDQPDVFPDNWIYVHSPEVRLGRVQNFKNWSPDLVPDASKSALGLEYFVNRGDDLWSLRDEELVDLGRREMERLGLVDAGDIEDGVVLRVPRAYPAYDHGYREDLARIQRYLDGFENLQTVGRNGQHRYNNQDHSMLAGMYAARRVLGGRHDPWKVNVDSDYQEAGSGATGRLAADGFAGLELEQVLRAAFARYDPVALGCAIGAVGGIGLFLATAILVLRGGEPLGPNLSLLANYFVGFEVGWRGATIGLVEAGVGGFLFGAVLACAINALVGVQERRVRRHLAVLAANDLLEPTE